MDTNGLYSAGCSSTCSKSTSNANYCNFDGCNTVSSLSTSICSLNFIMFRYLLHEWKLKNKLNFPSVSFFVVITKNLQILMILMSIHGKHNMGMTNMTLVFHQIHINII